jgi:NADH dehydrogenase
LGPRLAAAAGIETDRSGHVPVEPDLSLPGYPEVLVIGDLARFEHQGDGPLPGVAPVAMQQGKYAARLVRDRLRGRTREPFRYRDYGTMATIGRHRAVAVIGPLKFSGTLAWLAWLFIHVVQLIEFRDRVFVLAEWAYNYITWNRDARLITGHGAVPLHVGGGPQTMPSPSAGDPAAKEPDHPSTERLHQI